MSEPLDIFQITVVYVSFADLQSFREALVVLQRQVDELDDLKSSHYQEIVEHEEEVWNVVQSKVSPSIQTVNVLDDLFHERSVFSCVLQWMYSIALLQRRGYFSFSECGLLTILTSYHCSSDPVIEPMLHSVPDPFDAYGPPQSEDQIFSILAPLSLSMSASTPSTSTSPVVATSAGRGSMDVFLNNRISSWLPGTNGAIRSPAHSPELAEWASVSSPTATPPRSTSPANSTPSPSRGSSPPNGASRRHSVPTSTVRKAESKLRSVLAVIDEDKPRGQSSTPPVVPPSTTLTSSSLTSSTASFSEPDPHVSWNMIEEDHPANVEKEATRGSILFPSTSSLPPSDIFLPIFNSSKQHIDDGSEDCVHLIHS